MGDLDGAARLYEKILQKTQDGTLRSEAMAGLVQLHGVAARVSKAQVRREFLKTLDPERQAHVLQRRKDAKKAKRKRKMKDKEYKEAVDSERWIPKRDRTNYKKTRREK